MRFHFLLLLELERQVRRDCVGQAARLVDAAERSQNLGRDFLVQFHVLVELRHQRAAHRLDLVRNFVVRGNRRCVDREVRLDIYYLIDVCTLAAFDQHLHRTVGQLQHLQDIGYRADRVKIFGRGFVLGRRFLSN